MTTVTIAVLYSQFENEDGDASTSAAIPSVNNKNTSLLISSALVENNMTLEVVLESLSLTSDERIALRNKLGGSVIALNGMRSAVGGLLDLNVVALVVRRKNCTTSSILSVP